MSNTPDNINKLITNLNVNVLQSTSKKPAPKTAKMQDVIPVQLQSFSHRRGIARVCSMIWEEDVHVVRPSGEPV